MFLDKTHVDANESLEPKPYSGPKGTVGWIKNFCKFVCTHHHSESLLPHFTFPFYIFFKTLGPVALVTVQDYEPMSVLRGIVRGLILSLLYIMHGDWYNDYCDIEVDAKNKPSRPMPSGKCSKSQGLAIALFYPLLGTGVLGLIYLHSSFNVFLSYAIAFWGMVFCAFLYSDNNFPSRTIWRETVLGRAISFIGIYFFFDVLLYAEMADALNFDPFDTSSALLTPFIAYAITNLWFALGILITKDMGDIAGDKADGLSTIPIALGSNARSIGASLIVFTMMRITHVYFHLSGYYRADYYGLPISKIMIGIDVTFIAWYLRQMSLVVFNPKTDLKDAVKWFMKEFPLVTAGGQFECFLPAN